jgi:hypothetical protein
MPAVQNLTPSFGALAPAPSIPPAPKRADHPMDALFAGLSVDDEPTPPAACAPIAPAHPAAPAPSAAANLVGLYDSPAPPMGAASQMGGLFDMLGGPAPAPGVPNQTPSSGFDFFGAPQQVCRTQVRALVKGTLCLASTEPGFALGPPEAFLQSISPLTHQSRMQAPSC